MVIRVDIAIFIFIPLSVDKKIIGRTGLYGFWHYIAAGDRFVHGFNLS
jgi:hypothetical protein